MPSWWPHARAALIAVAVLAGLLDGCPIPSGATERAEMTKRLPAGAVAVVDRVDAVRRTLLAPLDPVGDAANLRQRWKLFSGAPPRRYRMWIEARRDGGSWELLYRPLDDAHAVLADRLGYRRVRGTWNPRGAGGPRGGYPAFVTWIAGEIFALDPAWVEVRVRMERVDLRAAGGVASTGEFAFTERRRRPAERRR